MYQCTWERQDYKLLRFGRTDLWREDVWQSECDWELNIEQLKINTNCEKELLKYTVCVFAVIEASSLLGKTLDIKRLQARLR